MQSKTKIKILKSYQPKYLAHMEYWNKKRSREHLTFMRNTRHLIQKLGYDIVAIGMCHEEEFKEKISNEIFMYLFVKTTEIHQLINSKHISCV